MGGGGSSSATVKQSSGGAASIRTGAFTASIPKGMAAETAAVAREMGMTKAQLVKRALADMLADIHNSKLIEERRLEPSIPHDEFWKKVGLEG